MLQKMKQNKTAGERVEIRRFFADVKLLLLILLLSLLLLTLFASKFKNYAKQFALNYYNY